MGEGNSHPGPFLAASQRPSTGSFSPPPRSSTEGSSSATICTNLASIVCHDTGSERYTGLYSTLFMVRKEDGGWRPVIDLKRLNHFILLERFKMESIHTIIQAVQPGGLMLSLDLQDAYLHVPILPSFQEVSQVCHWSHIPAIYQPALRPMHIP